MLNDIHDQRAVAILNKFNSFYETTWNKNHVILSGYDMDGNPLSDESDMPTTAGAIIGLSSTDQNLAREVYKEQITVNFYPINSDWIDEESSNNQIWGAFASEYLGVGISKNEMSLQINKSNNL